MSLPPKRHCHIHATCGWVQFYCQMKCLFSWLCWDRESACAVKGRVRAAVSAASPGLARRDSVACSLRHGHAPRKHFAQLPRLYAGGNPHKGKQETLLTLPHRGSTTQQELETTPG